MIISIGAKVKIKDNALPASRFFAGSMAMVIGYEHDPPKATSLHHLEIPGDVTFKWPSRFSWELEIIEEKKNEGHSRQEN